MAFHRNFARLIAYPGCAMEFFLPCCANPHLKAFLVAAVAIVVPVSFVKTMLALLPRHAKTPQDRRVSTILSVTLAFAPTSAEREEVCCANFPMRQNHVVPIPIV